MSSSAAVLCAVARPFIRSESLIEGSGEAASLCPVGVHKPAKTMLMNHHPSPPTLPQPHSHPVLTRTDAMGTRPSPVKACAWISCHK